MFSQEAVHVSALALPPAVGKGTQDTWRFPRQGGRPLDKTGAMPHDDQETRLGANRKGRGVYEPAF